MCFSYSGSYCWNMLPSDPKNTCSIDTFKYKILRISVVIVICYNRIVTHCTSLYRCPVSALWLCDHIKPPTLANSYRHSHQSLNNLFRKFFKRLPPNHVILMWSKPGRLQFGKHRGWVSIFPSKLLSNILVLKLTGLCPCRTKLALSVVPFFLHYEALHPSNLISPKELPQN